MLRALRPQQIHNILHHIYKLQKLKHLPPARNILSNLFANNHTLNLIQPIKFLNICIINAYSTKSWYSFECFMQVTYKFALYWIKAQTLSRPLLVFIMLLSFMSSLVMTAPITLTALGACWTHYKVSPEIDYFMKLLRTSPIAVLASKLVPQVDSKLP